MIGVGLLDDVPLVAVRALEFIAGL
jgi:hypothetical protein